MLTDLVIRQTKPPTTGRLWLWDEKPRGLALRITPNDVRSWCVFYRFKGLKRLLTLDRYRSEDSDPAVTTGLTLGAARRRAVGVLRDVDAGRDPQAEKATAARSARAEALRAGATLAQLAERWLAEGRVAKGERKGQPWRPSTRAEFERLVRDEIVPVLGALDPGAVTKAHIRTLYDNLEKRSASAAKHTLAVLRLFYQWAAEEDHVDAVPLFPKRGTQSAKRTRVLEDPELRAVWTALEAGISEDAQPGKVEPMSEAFKLMLLTAQRRGEVLSMRWGDVSEESDGAWWTIPAERHKGGCEQRVPLTAPAVESLKRLHGITASEEWLFPSPKPTAKLPFVGNPQKAAGRLWKAVDLKGSAHVHDLRRTAATYMTRLGVPRLVVGKVLGHADTDVTGRYDKHAYDREKRAALQKWADELLRIVASKDAAASSAKVLPWAR